MIRIVFKNQLLCGKWIWVKYMYYKRTICFYDGPSKRWWLREWLGKETWMDFTYIQKVDSLGDGDRLNMERGVLREQEGARTTLWFLV